MIQTVSALLVVVGTLALLRAVLSLSGVGGRGTGGGARDRLRVAKTCVLSGRQRLHVVEVEGERLLLGATDGSIRVLRELPPAPEPRVSDGGPGSVAEIAERSGLNRTVAHRLIATLEARGYLRRGPYGDFSLGSFFGFAGFA